MRKESDLPHREPETLQLPCWKRGILTHKLAVGLSIDENGLTSGLMSPGVASVYLRRDNRYMGEPIGGSHVYTNELPGTQSAFPKRA